MADQSAIESVGKKLQAWAQGLDSNEQQAFAEWMQNASGSDVQGFSANWWQSTNAWANAWNSWWAE